jgi:hypothetical protein
VQRIARQQRERSNIVQHPVQISCFHADENELPARLAARYPRATKKNLTRQAARNVPDKIHVRQPDQVADSFLYRVAMSRDLGG